MVYANRLTARINLHPLGVVAGPTAEGSTFIEDHDPIRRRLRTTAGDLGTPPRSSATSLPLQKRKAGPGVL